MKISGSALLAGVIGWPVSHSLSPLLHSHWLTEYGVDGAFVPLAVERQNFSAALRGLRVCGFRGVNVTVPHKEAAFAIAHDCDPEAKATRAANLLLFADDGRIEARNTDSRGLAANLSETLGAGALTGKRAILVGAGGAARATARALDSLGASEICILNRTPARAERLIRDLAPSTKAKLVIARLEEWPQAAKGAALLVNATSAGMKGSAPLDLPLEAVDAGTSVCDLVYNPLETPLLKAARGRALKTVDGLGMLMHQAVPAFEAFYGHRPAVTPALRRVLEKALNV